MSAVPHIFLGSTAGTGSLEKIAPCPLTDIDRDIDSASIEWNEHRWFDEKQFEKAISCMIESGCEFCFDNLRNVFVSIREDHLNNFSSASRLHSSWCWSDYTDDSSSSFSFPDMICSSSNFLASSDADENHPISSDLFLSINFPDKLFRFLGSSIISQTLDSFFQGSHDLWNWPTKKKNIFRKIVDFFLCPQLLQFILFKSMCSSRNEDQINAIFSCLSFTVDRKLYMSLISSAIRAENTWMIVALCMKSTFETVIKHFSTNNNSRQLSTDSFPEKVDVFQESRKKWDELFLHRIDENNNVIGNHIPDENDLFRDRSFEQSFLSLSDEEIKWLLTNSEPHHPISSFSLETLFILFRNGHPFMLQSKQALDFLRLGNVEALGYMLLVFCEDFMENRMTCDDFFNDRDGNVSLMKFSEILFQNPKIRETILEKKTGNMTARLINQTDQDTPFRDVGDIIEFFSMIHLDLENNEKDEQER